MKRIAAAGMIAAILTLFTPSPAQAEEGCVINVAGIKVCGELLEPLPTVTVTLPPDIIRLPGPTVTLPPEQVPVPGPTTTVEIPGPTETVTVQPNNPGPSELPQPTVTETVTADPTGQPTPSRATVTPSPEVETETDTETETRTKTETIVRNILVGSLALIVLAGLAMLALWTGYVLGYKGAERQEARSLRNLLDSIKSRGKHS